MWSTDAYNYDVPLRLHPLSAQIGNAISNDGDALFPAIAMAPKAAIVATIYSALPALVVAYGWYFLVENS